MRHLPTQTNLSDLGVQLAVDGFGPHELAVSEVLSIAQEIGAPSELTNLIGDTGTPMVVRARAFAKLSRIWVDLRRAALRNDTDLLLKAWVAHDDLKKTNPTVAELWASHIALAEQREVVAGHRCA